MMMTMSKMKWQMLSGKKDEIDNYKTETDLQDIVKVQNDSQSVSDKVGKRSG